MQTIDATVEAGVGRLTLARPEAGNAIDLTMARELMQVTTVWSTDPTIRVVVLSGSGPRFCVGGDLKSFADRTDLASHLTEVTTNLHAAIGRLARMDAPVLAAVHGSAAGAGFSLACAADLVIVARSARMVAAYPAVGLTPDGSLTWSLPRLVGMRRALDLALTNRTIDATEAEQLGIATAVVDDDRLDAEVEALARQLAQGPTAALGETKRLLRTSLDHSIETQMERETTALAAMVTGRNGREGIAAFVEKRRPDFGGPYPVAGDDPNRSQPSRAEDEPEH